MDAALSLDFRRHAQDLRETWQCKALADALYDAGISGIVRPRHKLGMCMLSVVSHSFDEAMEVILRVAFPTFEAVGTPFLCTAAKIAKTGHVMADMIAKDGRKYKNQVLFRSTRQMEKDLRHLADRMSLNDADRVDLFNAAKRWVVCDFRLDPNMNAADPDARRLVH